MKGRMNTILLRSKIKVRREMGGAGGAASARVRMLSHSWVRLLKLQYGGARILYIKIRGRRTTLTHTRPHTQSRGG